MTARRAAPVPPRTDPEVDIARAFTLPTARTLLGERHRRALALVPDDVHRPTARHDRARGRWPRTRRDGCPATSQDRASSTLDGSLRHGVEPRARARRTAIGSSTTWPGPSPSTTCRWPSSPTAGIRCPPRSRSAPAARAAPWPSRRWPTAPTPWATTDVTLSLPAAHRRPGPGHLRHGASRDRPRLLLRQARSALPIGIAELAIPGMPRLAAGAGHAAGHVSQRPAHAWTAGRCPSRITGTTATRRRRSGTLQVQGCGRAAQRDHAGAGSHLLQTQPGCHARGGRRHRQPGPRLGPGRGRPRPRAVGTVPCPRTRARRRR